ncbi:hypothetical protein HZF05_02050 [Sphingomonas sp. CGMCC 1.13654]|uniref:Glycosyl transferase n=1 Tax=Sphingomonas chungangi TaxID=2683589 RepID=A0A838L1R4_9SPHN|nr:hypothetical protein [Sphingomonas chungangi]MBA2932870.1 hypothetical protein [Sphingomonas chungangi]MVW56490.1 hypothetical protein [Sphingomonas chungangi]
MKPPRVAFLFLGETLLIPHLYPIVEALAAEAPDLDIECWVATSVHEGLLSGWLSDAGLAARVRLRRVPGFLDLPALTHGENPPLPAKLPMLARLAGYLLRVDAVICAEQTSLWLPRLLPFLRRRFIKAAHGAGSMMARSDPRRRAAHHLLVPAAREKGRLVDVGVPSERIVVVGYVKAGFRGLAHPPRLFADDRPVIVYAPHWQRHRSSWWAWGRQIVDMLAQQGRLNVILAPHQRLVEKAPEVREVLAAVAHLPHLHTDLDSFAMVDGSYMGAADLYLGDTSSQVVEFLMRPRPCVFLNPERVDWRATDDHDFWACGEVVDRLDALPEALARARAEHPRYQAEQRGFATDALGDASPEAAHRAARAVIAALK